MVGPVEIDSGLIRRLIGQQFPQWAHLPIRSVEPDGWDNRTFRLGNDMSVRLPSAKRYVAQVEKEHRWLPVIAPHLPLPVPVPLARGVPAKGYPWPWSVYRWLEGEPASNGHITDPVQFARSLAEFLNALYCIDATGGPPAGAHNFHRGGKLAVYNAESRAALTTLADRIDVANADNVWRDALASEWRILPVWVHGDVAIGNLLVRNGRLCAVIDFGSMAVGDPACDLATAWTLFSGTSRRTFRVALPFDEETWARARGWALWKALITASGHDSNQREADRSWQVIREVITDPLRADHP